jgi:hypothetical protein
MKRTARRMRIDQREGVITGVRGFAASYPGFLSVKGSTCIYLRQQSINP